MKRLIGFLLIIALLTTFLIPSFAFERDEHDKYLEKVLFKSGPVPAGGNDKVKMLECASYLMLDQCNGNGEIDLEYLKTHGVSNLPKSIGEIDFSGNQLHRRYTHQGWNYTYTGEKDKANWPVRKDIQRSTTNQVFDFGMTNEIAGRFCAQCDSFSALVYYVHILGDMIHDEKPKGSSEQLPFARHNADENTPDIFFELQPHMETLFNDTADSRRYTYNGFMRKYDVLARKARFLEETSGGVNTQEEITQQKEYEKALMDLLVAYVPRLLKRTDFFAKAFY